MTTFPHAPRSHIERTVMSVGENILNTITVHLTDV